MPASRSPQAQTIVALNISLGFTQQGQRLWRINVGTIDYFAVDQPMQQVQHASWLPPSRPGPIPQPDNNLFVVVKDKSKDIGHLSITAGAAKGARNWQLE